MQVRPYNAPAYPTNWDIDQLAMPLLAASGKSMFEMIHDPIAGQPIPAVEYFRTRARELLVIAGPLLGVLKSYGVFPE